MSEEEQPISQHIDDEPPAEEKPSLLRRIGRIIRRILVFLLLFFVTLSIGIVILTQTKGFRQWLGGQILSFVNGELEGRIEFSDMGGDLLTGLTFDDVRLIARGDTVLYAKQLSLRYELAPLLNQTIVVNRLYLDSPVIKMIKGGPDSTWNFEHIAKPSTDTSASAPFDWTINVRNLTISNGTFYMKDKTTPAREAVTFEQLNASDMRLDDLNLSLTALAHFKARDFAVTINRISCRDHNSSFALRNLSGKVNIDKTHTEIFDLRLITGRTDLVLNAQLEDLDLFDNFDPSVWDKTPAQVNLHADSVSTDDLRYFLPALDFLEGSVALSLDAEGTYGDLAINNLELSLSHSTLSMKGKLRNLNTPEKLYIDARLDRTKVSYADVRAHLPGLDIPNLAYLGQVMIDEATFRGEPTNFQSNFKVRTAIGNARGSGTLNVGASPMRYAAHLETEKLDLAPPLSMPELKSSLNAIVDIEGVGTTLRDLNTRVRMTANNSEIAGRPFKDLYLVGSARERGLINADTLRIVWNTSPGMHNDGLSSFDGSGWLNMRNTSMPVYRFSAVLDNVNLANVMDDPSFATQLTGKLQVSGKGFEPDSIEGTITADFERLATPDRAFDSLQLTATLIREPNNYRDLQVHSPLADIFLRGNYRFTTLADALARQVEVVTNSIQQRYRDITTTELDSFSVRQTERIAAVPLEDLNLDYYIRVRDLAPASMFIDAETIHGDVLLQGSITGTTQDFLFTLDSSQITSLFYQDSSMTISATPIELGARLRTPARVDMGGLEAQVYINNDSTIIFNDNVLSGTLLDAEYKNEQVTFRAKSDINSTIDFSAVGGGDFDVSGTRYSITLDSLTVGYLSSLQWHNEGVIKASFADNTITIDSLSMARNEGEHISVHGSYGSDQFRDIEVAIESMPISDINRFIPSDGERVESTALLNGRLTRLGVTLNGTMKSPEIELYARLDSLTYNSFPIGNQTIDLTYKDKQAQGSTIVVNPLLKQDSTTLTLDIKALPIDLAFADVKERIVSGGPVDISMKAKRFSLGLVAPFVPSVDKLQGYANADFRIEGTTPGNVNYSGNASFFNTSFLLTSTNVRYAADGVVQLQKDLIKVKEINLYNDRLDLSNGRAKIYGELSFDGLDLTYIDLFITTPGFLVMNQASKAASPTLYGDMIISSEQDPLHFYGTLEKPYLRGSVNILRADLVFPEDRSVALSAQNFCYKMVRRENGELKVTVIDCVSDPTQSTTASAAVSASSTTATTTTSTAQQESIEANDKRDSVDSERSAPKLERMAQDVVRSAILRPNQSLVDLMDIDLKLDITGRFFLTMELGTLRSLNTEVTLQDPTEPLRYTQYGSARKLYGSLTVKEGSTLTFYRTFKANGTISFPAGRIDNPQLDIVAEYEGRRLKEQEFEQFEVQIDVTGTKEKPQFAMSYSINGNEAGGDQAQIQADAIMLIVFGRTQSELLASGSRGNLISSLGQDAVTAGASAFLSNLFSNSGGIIRTAEIDLQGNEANNQTVDFSRSRLRFSGELSSFAQYRIESDAEMANTNFTLDIPLGAYFDTDMLRNLALEITRAANSINTITTQQREWEVKLGWRWSF